MAIRIPIITDLQDKGIQEARRQFGKFKADVAAADGTMGKFKAGSKAAFDGVKAQAGNLAMVAGAAIAGFAIKAVGDFQDLAIAAGKFSDATGLTVEDASKFMEAAGDIGVPVDKLEGAIGRLNRTIGADPDKVRDLGVDLVYLNDGSLDVNETFLNTIDRIKAIKDPAEKAKVAAQLLGKGWQDMAELIELGADDLKRSLDSVSGSKIIDESEVRKAKEFRAAQDNLKDVMEDLALEIGESLVPALADLLELASDFAGAESPGGGSWFGKVIDASVLFANVIQKGPYQAFKDLYGEVELTDEELFKVAEQMYRARIPAEELTTDLEDLTEVVSATDAAFEALKGELKLEGAVLDAKAMLDQLKEKAVEAFNGADGALGEYEQSLVDAKLKVLDLAEMITLTDSQKNQIRVLVDTGELERAIGLIGIIGAGGYTPELNAMRYRGARASGGPVAGGGTYLVGERGPELFTPGTSGNITPNNALGGGGITVNVNGGDPNSIVRALQQYVRQSGPVPVNTRAM
jgi:hypothetical protein